MLSLGLLQTKQLRTVLYKSLYGHMFSFLLGKYPGVEWLDHMLPCLTFYKMMRPGLQLRVHRGIFTTYLEPWQRKTSFTVTYVCQSTHFLVHSFALKVKLFKGSALCKDLSSSTSETLAESLILCSHTLTLCCRG